jgi:hypothetical protein
MGYDRFPELLVDEKSDILAKLAEQRGTLLYTHDPEFAASRVVLDAKGRYVPAETERVLAGWDLDTASSARTAPAQAVADRLC